MSIVFLHFAQIRELEDRKKIQTLLQLSGVTESEVSYFMKEPPAMAIVPQKLPPKLHNHLRNDKGQATTSIISSPKIDLWRFYKVPTHLEIREMSGGGD